MAIPLKYSKVNGSSWLLFHLLILLSMGDSDKVGGGGFSSIKDVIDYERINYLEQ